MMAEFWVELGFSVVLQILQTQKRATPFFKVIAKVAAKIEKVAMTSPELQALIDLQRQKEGLA